MLKYVVICGILTLAPIFYVGAEIQTHDYCRARKSRLTDEQLKRLAVQNLVGQGALKLESFGQSATDYVARNPGCCRVYRSPPFPWIISLFRKGSYGGGDRAFGVEVIFERNAINPLRKR